MEQTLTLLVMLAGVSCVAGTKLSGVQNTTAHSLTPGGSVSIYVINNASGLQVLCKKHLPTGPVRVFILRKGMVTIEEDFKNRMRYFINNGTFEITNVAMSDSGLYIVEVFDSDGVLIRHLRVLLDVQEHMLSSILIPASAGAGALVLLILLVIICVCVCKSKKTAGASI